MTKSDVVIVSVIRDLLDFTPFGHIPLLDQMLDLPVIYMHVKYAGPRGLTTIPELIPLVGILPIFTVLALSYPSDL